MQHRQCHKARNSKTTFKSITVIWSYILKVHEEVRSHVSPIVLPLNIPFMS